MIKGIKFIGKIKTAPSGPVILPYFVGALGAPNSPRTAKAPVICFEYINSSTGHFDALQQDCFVKEDIGNYSF